MDRDEKILKIWRYILASLGIAAIIYSVLIGLIYKFVIAHFLGILFGVVLLVIAIFIPKNYGYNYYKVLVKRGFIALLAYFVILLGLSGLLIYSKAQSEPVPGADAIIVLGAGLNDDKVSQTLAARLDIAYLYCYKNPYTLIVVSGGQNANEKIPEAQAMENYLVKNGMPKERIIQENKSIRTKSNFVNSKKILDQYFEQTFGKAKDDYQIVYATSNFHVYRAGLIAQQTGFKNVSGAAAPVPKDYITMYYLREILAVIFNWGFPWA